MRVTLYVFPVLSYDPRVEILYTKWSSYRWGIKRRTAGSRKILCIPSICILKKCLLTSSYTLSPSLASNAHKKWASQPLQNVRRELWTRKRAHSKKIQIQKRYWLRPTLQWPSQDFILLIEPYSQGVASLVSSTVNLEGLYQQQNLRASDVSDLSPVEADETEDPTS